MYADECEKLSYWSAPLYLSISYYNHNEFRLDLLVLMSSSKGFTAVTAVTAVNLSTEKSYRSQISLTSLEASDMKFFYFINGDLKGFLYNSAFQVPDYSRMRSLSHAC